MILTVNNLCFLYGKHKIIHDLSFDLEEGAFLGIAGPNGAGKTTLLHLLCKQLKAHSGSIRIMDKTILEYTYHSLARQIAIVPQEQYSVYGYSCYEIVMMARYIHRGNFYFESKQDHEIVTEAMEVTNTIDFSNQNISHLSAGQRQRVFIARAIAQQTPILMMDEPTSNLDIKNQVLIFDLLKKYQTKYYKTIIIVNHDLNYALQYCDKILMMNSHGDYEVNMPDKMVNVEMVRRFFGVDVSLFSCGEKKVLFPDTHHGRV